MSRLQAGFARLDITPSLGTYVQGYAKKRYADGILDPILITAVAFDNGEKRTVIISADLLGIRQFFVDQIRTLVAAAIGTEKEGVFFCCTHTHLGPGITFGDKTVNPEYVEQFLKKVQDVAILAVNDLAPAELLFTQNLVHDVAFVRRFKMKDGKYKTNPGYKNPDVEYADGEPDENVSLLIIKRENAPEIGIVNFQVHPDVIGGSKLSADYPKFVRDTYEKLIENSRCMYINGAQGDTNHVDIRLGEDSCRGGYERAEYMGKKIALAAISNYMLAVPIAGDEIGFAQKSIFVKYNKGRPEQIEDAMLTVKIWDEQGGKAALPANTGVKNIKSLYEAKRIVTLMDLPDEGELYLTAVRVGDVVFAGLPGEPFTDIGRQIKENSKFSLTLPACCANGYEGYFPMRSIYSKGGYECNTAKYVAGVAEMLIEASTEIINSL